MLLEFHKILKLQSLKVVSHNYEELRIIVNIYSTEHWIRSMVR